ncbi:gamma-glutamylcyclotransferase family protein [Halorubrum sp. DTA46]|uniref:gamma-glutamylcyclotransferase family protein n=1 Tax=Halorubrum sp. DTA46 TaxID=3402162 RepID=UPI003AAEFE49
MDVFVYGTLTEPEQVAEVLDSFVFVGSATLTGLRPVEGRYPTLAPPGPDDTEIETAGRLLRTNEIAALDAYERVDDGLYHRVSVPLDAPTEATGANAAEAKAADAPADHPDEAAVYLGDPERLGAAATWPGDGPFGERVSAFLDEADVRVRVAPQDPV